MKRNRKDTRDIGIGKRMRRRRIRAYRAQQKLERELAAPRADRLAMLAKLCGTLECGHFPEHELREAEAALRQRSPDSPQSVLPLMVNDHA